MNLITETGALAEFCGRAAQSEYITVDTEFIRDKTYWPKLCLVQIASAEEAAIIDALAPGIDLAPLFELMVEPDVLKVFHAARQDIEIFDYLSSRIPTPIFDTQVAAMVCGFGDSVGYDKLVHALTKAHIDKSLRFTDWSKRPLAKRMLDYALSDVTHLRPVYEKLAAEVKQNGRATWLDEEMAVLTDPATYRQDPAESWHRVKTRIRKPRHLAILRALAAWREETAQARDIPRVRVMRDEALNDIAVHEPKSPKDLQGLRSVRTDQLGEKRARELLDVVAAALALPESEYPRVDHRNAQLSKVGPACDLLKVLLKLKCEQHKVAQKLVASSDDIEAIARDDEADVPALRGWRRELFGADALALKHGRLALTGKGGALRVIELDN
jgi:ribonuclease D